VGDLDRVLVDLLHLGAHFLSLGVRGEIAVVELLAEGLGDEHVLPIEEHVIRVEGFAVGPLHAFPEMDRELRVVSVDVDALGHIGDDRGAVGREAEQRLLGEHEAPLVAGVALADLLRDLLHHRILGEPLRERREPAACHFLVEHRRLMPLIAALGGREARGRGQQECHQHREEAVERCPCTHATLLYETS
jgi:hypothetical protein